MPLKSQMYIEMPVWLITRKVQEYRQVLKQECMACQLVSGVLILPRQHGAKTLDHSYGNFNELKIDGIGGHGYLISCCLRASVYGSVYPFKVTRNAPLY